MKFLRHLNEEYVATGKGLIDTGMRDKTVSFPIYKNPGTSDYKEIRKEYGNRNVDLEFRAIIDLKNKNIYIWNALDGVHIEGFNALKASGELKIEPDSSYNLFCGGGTLKKGSNKLSGSYDFLSFMEYIQYYGLGKSKTFDGSTEELEEKAAWLKNYFPAGFEVTKRFMKGPIILTHS